MRRSWLAMLAAPVLLGQSAFDVATIKPHDPQNPIMIASGYSPLRFTATGTLRDLLRIAYAVQDAQIAGGPGWMSSQRFDLEGRTEQPASAEQRKAMLQALLAERFLVALHHESRELPVYELQAAKGGPKLHAAAADSTGFSSGTSKISGQVPVAELVRYLSQTLGRTVIDRTGLEGNFDVKLEWKPDEESIFTAIQEQLGLRLEPAKAAVDVLVIDRAERPSEN